MSETDNPNCKFKWFCLCCKQITDEFYDDEKQNHRFKATIRLPIGPNGSRICLECIFEAIRNEIR